MPETSRKIDIETESIEKKLEKKIKAKEKKHPAGKREYPAKNKTIKKEKELEKKVKGLKESLANMVKEKDDYIDKYLRGLAEIDNFRKRFIKEKEEYKKYFLGEFLHELLQVSDNLERALQAKSDSENCKSILSGVEITEKQRKELCQK